MRDFEKLKLLAKKHKVFFKAFNKRHVRLTKGSMVLDYWPDSRNRKVFLIKNGVSGRGHKNFSPEDVIQILVTGKAPTPDNLKPAMTYSSGEQDFYSGESPPWELD